MILVRPKILKKVNAVYCVPDLQLNMLVFKRDCSRPEFNTNSQIMRRFESFVRKLKKQAGFPDACFKS